MISIWKTLTFLYVKAVKGTEITCVFSEHKIPYSKSRKFNQLKQLIADNPTMPISVKYDCMDGAYALFDDNQSATITESGPFVIIVRTDDTYTKFSDKEVHTTDLKEYIMDTYLLKK